MSLSSATPLYVSVILCLQAASVCTGHMHASSLQKSSLQGARLAVHGRAPSAARTSRLVVRAGQLLGGKKVNKVVLAYSGGLDTSVILTWLRDTYDCEVVTFTADLGQVVFCPQIAFHALYLSFLL